MKDREDLPDDEKVKLYTKELNSLKRYRDAILTPKEFSINIKGNGKASMNEESEKKIQTNISTNDLEQPEKSQVEESKVEDILFTLPKTLRKEASQILRFIKSKPEQLNWNQNKELVYQGSVLRLSLIHI